MQEIRLSGENLERKQVEGALQTWLNDCRISLKKVLLLPPDFTRFHSQAGLIIQLLYRILSPSCQVKIMPATGTHLPMNSAEKQYMFGKSVPEECFLDHDWRRDIVKIGEIPSDFIQSVSDGLVRFAVDVEINRHLLDPSYDLIISVGQVVPHEVVGMANFTKNILVGCGGKDIINKSHFLGAAYGMERIMGRDHSPVRRVFDYAETNFLDKLPLQYIFTVVSTAGSESRLNGLFIGRSRKQFEEAVALSRKKNLDLLDRPLQKAVVYLDPQEFKSTWLGNKAIYRTRMALAYGGELIILAPGVGQFGEDPDIDRLIRKYGYVGSARVLQLVEREADLQSNLSAAAHLIHGSPENRFQVTYAPGSLSRSEITSVNFQYMDLHEALEKYNPAVLHDGFNTLKNGEEIFYISNPAVGLWALREKFHDPAH